MPRPRRNEQATRQFSLYMSPDALDRLKAAAADAKLSPGAYVERLVGFGVQVHDLNLAGKKPVAASGRAHVMVTHPANPNLGRWCANCHLLTNACAKSPICPGSPE